MSGAPHWRSIALGAVSAGLAIAPVGAVEPGAAWALLAVGSVCAGALALAKPVAGVQAAAWSALLVAALAVAALGLGVLRVAAIDHGAYRSRDGVSAVVTGYVAATPRRSAGEVSIRLSTPAGRLAVRAHEPVADLEIGRQVTATGELRAPRPWEAGYLARNGIFTVLSARRLRVDDARRGGFAGAVDSVRNRSAAALGASTPEPEAALLRGFVLGQDDRIDASTVSDFRRSGLAHLLAVSGENIALLALLGAPILALAGVPHRARIAWLLGLIGLYVLVTGAGASIQRAGVMGAAALVATLASRPRSRWHIIGLAAALTLAMNPRCTGDPGWQLSFAAVIGIMLGAAPIRDSLLPPGGSARPIRRALAEGAGVTIAATLATAPLIAATFDNFSLTTLPANLLALPAVAPVMWLGMLTAGLGQIPLVPVGPLDAIAGALAAYVAQVAHWLGSPAWAQVDVPAVPPGAIAALYGLAGIACTAFLAARRRRRALAPHRALVAAVAAVAALALLVSSPSAGAPAAAQPSLHVSVLDVGQGDAILFAPAHGGAVLVDGGPYGDDLAAKLAAVGVTHLAAAVVTHDQADHAGGIEQLLGSFPVGRLVYAVPARRLSRSARAAGVRTVQVAAGSELAAGGLHLRVLWPPPELERGPAAKGVDPNTLAVVALARFRGFSMLLTADAEAADVPIDPGPLDVLKVAHHGSADAGLGSLLERTDPELAVISVGAGNPYGHPAPQTLRTLAEHHVPVLRTDTSGSIELDVGRSGWSVRR